jgi:Fur family transcriptional regulator, peroxide stress response regulator
MDTKNESYSLFVNKCRENNLKITPQRTAIYQALLNASDHPSADIIYKRVRKKYPHISLDTVNRAVLSFAHLGIIKIVEGYGKPKRFDSDTDNHHHFQCMNCHKIIDFHNKTYDDLEIPNGIKNKFTVLYKKVVLEGLCDKCKR